MDRQFLRPRRSLAGLPSGHLLARAGRTAGDGRGGHGADVADGAGYQSITAATHLLRRPGNGCILYRHGPGIRLLDHERAAGFRRRRRDPDAGHPALRRLPRRRGVRGAADEHGRTADRPVDTTQNLRALKTPVSGFRVPVSGKTVVSRKSPKNSKPVFPTSDFRLPTSDFRLPTFGSAFDFPETRNRKPEPALSSTSQQRWSCDNRRGPERSPA